jgi:hypothetical protein
VRTEPFAGTESVRGQENQQLRRLQEETATADDSLMKEVEVAEATRKVEAAFAEGKAQVPPSCWVVQYTELVGSEV